MSEETLPMTATIPNIPLPTAEHIAALFREHDIIPEQLVYLDTSGTYPKCRACAIGILLVEIRGSATKARAACRSIRTVFDALAEASGLPPAFLNGLDDGFTNSDGGEVCVEDVHECSPLYAEGYRVGWESWALASAGVSPPEEDRP
jgi:hypothetical protein